jgi:hypothetical protein
MVKLEDIVGVIQGVKGRTSDIVYDLFFAEKRMVAAVVLYFSDLTGPYGGISLKTLLLGTLFTRRGIKMRSLKLMDERRLAFKDKSLDEILTLHRANLEVDYEDVVSVSIRKGVLETSLEFAVQRRPVKKIDFWLERNQVAEVEGLINRVLPNKVK